MCGPPASLGSPGSKLWSRQRLLVGPEDEGPWELRHPQHACLPSGASRAGIQAAPGTWPAEPPRADPTSIGAPPRPSRAHPGPRLTPRPFCPSSPPSHVLLSFRPPDLRPPSGPRTLASVRCCLFREAPCHLPRLKGRPLSARAVHFPHQTSGREDGDPGRHRPARGRAWVHIQGALLQGVSGAPGTFTV